jgi:16S rRNA (adenine1518-N6/adenine1519-N6)-dimethyltransferase
MKNHIDPSKIADKRFGQNFLQEAHYIDRIIEAMPEDDLPIAEIGPGLGDLTSALVRVRRVTAFEVDKRLCEHLRERFDSQIESNTLTLICGDALERWERTGLLDEPYHLVANLPYYVATHFVLKALRDPWCRSLTVMVQKEVALKFSARAGERSFSALSVLAQSAGEARIRFEVPPEAFTPPPKVTSAVLSIDKERTLHTGSFDTFLKTAFAQPRKKLAKNLERLFPKEAVRTALLDAGLDPAVRPHQAATSTYHHLYTLLTKDVNDGQKTTRKRKGQQRH